MTALTDAVDELFAAWNKPDSPGCALAIIQDGAIAYERGYGMADLEREVPISPVSVFDIGSTGKQFTAMLMAILAKQGDLSLDDTIHKYVPEMPSYEQPITIRHLIHHTSGLRDYTTLMHLSDMHFENFYYEDELLELICRQKQLNFRPGDEFLYSNTGYFLLGIVAKRITGQSFPELIRQNILKPLGMQATDFNDDAKRIVKNRAVGYSPKEGDGYCTDMSFCGGYGDGAILTTVKDLFLWDQNFYNNKLGGGGEELIQEMLAPGELNSGEGLDYAFGLFITDYRGLRMVSHGGGWAGYRSELVRFPDQKLSVVCLSNLTSVNPSRLAQQVADLYLADQLAAPEQPSDQEATEFSGLSIGQIESITGFYRNQKAGNILELSTQDGELVAKAFGLRFQLVATSSTHLKAIEPPHDVQIELEGPHPEGAPTIGVKLEGRKPESYRKMTTTPVTPSQMAAYEGSYRSDELDISYRILLDEGQLFLKRGYSAREALCPVTQDLFTSGLLDLQFERNEEDEVCTLRLGADRVRDLVFLR
jgi:CubicO group peptidase (beta-lactamase class C family)